VPAYEDQERVIMAEGNVHVNGSWWRIEMLQRLWVLAIAALTGLLAASSACLGTVASYDGGIVVKNGDAEYAEGGAWEDGRNVGDYYRYGMDGGEARKTTSAGSWARWTPSLPAVGKYRVYLWHIVWGARGNVTIEIQHNGQTTTLKRNTGDGHSGWNSLGDYDFAAGTDGNVKVTLEDKGILYASAVKFLPVDKVGNTTFPPYPKPDGSTPRAEKGNIVICGQPRLVLYGETLEETMAHPADVPYYGDQFDKWRRQGLNTVGAIIQWNAFEPRKDQYEYAMIDGLIEAARERNMHLIIVWFGTWRNLQSNYVPRYVWEEKLAFPALKPDGKIDNGRVSPFATKCAERDGLALKALLARAAEKDPGHQVLIAVQVENEMPKGQCYTAEANAHFAQQMPAEVMDMLKREYNTTEYIGPSKQSFSIWAAYKSCGRRTSGTWEEVLSRRDIGTGPGESARIIMGVYHTGKYIETVVRMAKQSLNIPMYANAWCGESPCDSEYMDIFHVGCPSLDGMGPDSGGDVLFKWKRPWNVLVQPEFSMVENYFRALSDGALLSGQYWNGEVELVRSRPTFDLVRTMEPLLVQKRNPGDLLGFTTAPHSAYGGVDPKKLPKAGTVWEQDYQDLKLKFTYTADWVLEWLAPVHTAGPVLNGNGLIIRIGPDEYILTSTKIDVELRRADGSAMGLAWAEEGHFADGKWVKEKDAPVGGMGVSLKLRFPTANGQYGHVRLKLAAPNAASPAPAQSPVVRHVRVATPAGEQVKDIAYYNNSLGMEFVRIEAGEFAMGEPGRQKSTGPQHQVRITRPFLAHPTNA
jgi:hypothetical protein